IDENTAGINLANSDHLGDGVSFNAAGDILAVGASGDDTGGADRGAAYLFTLNTSDLTQVPSLKYKLTDNLPDPAFSLSNGDGFFAVALNDAGNILAVGAHQADGSGTNRGAVYLFNLNTADLTQDPVYRYVIKDSYSAVDPSFNLDNNDYF